MTVINHVVTTDHEDVLIKWVPRRSSSSAEKMLCKNVKIRDTRDTSSVLTTMKESGGRDSDPINRETMCILCKRGS